MKTFIQTTIPESLIEAAVIDGAHHFFIFRKIVAPLSVAVFATLGLFQAVYHWNDWFVGAYFIFDDRLLPLQTYLQRLIRGAERQLERLTEREHTDMALISPRSLTMAAIIVSRRAYHLRVSVHPEGTSSRGFGSARSSSSALLTSGDPRGQYQVAPDTGQGPPGRREPASCRDDRANRPTDDPRRGG